MVNFNGEEKEVFYKCRNCGFIFKIPKTVWRMKSYNPAEFLVIDARASYYPIEVCPRCESDAIKAFVEEDTCKFSRRGEEK